MMRIKYEASDYERIDSVKTLVDSVATLFDKFYNDFNDRYEPLQKAEKDIDDKKKEIESYSSTIRDCDLKIDELGRLRDKTKGDIEELSLKKKDISYTDSEVQRMEEEDIDSEISSKTEKIAKIETKLLNTQEKREINKFNKEDAEKELNELIIFKNHQEAYIKKTEDLLDLITATKEKFEEDIAKILEDESDTSVEEPVISEEENTDYPKIDFDLKEIELDYDTKDDLEEVELPSEKVNEVSEEVEPLKEEASGIEVSHVTEETVEDNISSEKLQNDEKKELEESPLKKIFESNGIKYEDFSDEARASFEQNTERVKENIEVLKKHELPLELTLNQSEIYYKKDAKELDELIKIITTDEEGNGMGFTIDFIYYILDELAAVDIDKLINVYNNEFMKVDAKSGLIELLKKTDNEIGAFENNKNANKEVLTELGVTTVSEIEKTYPEFLALDNPLFLNALNLFDKEDLVEKLNREIKIIPKIIAYWRKN